MAIRIANQLHDLDRSSVEFSIVEHKTGYNVTCYAMQDISVVIQFNSKSNIYIVDPQRLSFPHAHKHNNEDPTLSLARGDHSYVTKTIAQLISPFVVAYSFRLWK